MPDGWLLARAMLIFIDRIGGQPTFVHQLPVAPIVQTIAAI